MNKAYQRKLPLYLSLIGFVLLLLSCSLQFLKIKQTSILYNLSITEFRTKIDGKIWGDGQTSADSMICVRFDQSGIILVKTFTHGLYDAVGRWAFTLDPVPTHGTLTIQNSVGISVKYEWPSLQLVVEFQGQRLHLLRN